MKKRKDEGYILIILMFAVLLMSLGFLVAAPIWKTQIQREKEEELIFRGKQYVEAVRLYQIKNPGKYPEDIETLVEEKFLRRQFEDPMTEDGKWGIIIVQQGMQGRQSSMAGPPQKRGPSRQGQPGAEGQGRGGGAVQKLMVVPQDIVESMKGAMIIGVVSLSKENSIKVYNDQTTYDKWLFYYGQDPNKTPEIVYYGEEEKEEKDL
jgi:type II secretory pathway pseudopilin PulG